ncbi:LysR substrate-binding domain-containing protein [Pigmentiphaga soli]
MTLQQLLCFCTLVDCDLRVARTADALHTTQPAVSKMIRALETTVGGDVFMRRGNRLVGLTDTGREALVLARRAVNAARGIDALVRHGSGRASGMLRVATTHIHARYALLPVVQRFARRYPDVSLSISQGAPAQIVDWVDQGAVDLGVSTPAAVMPPSVVALPSYPIERCLIAARGHPLLRTRPLTLAAIARHPLITYDENFSSGQVVLAAFQRAGITPRIALRATEAGIIKAYVAAGVGVAVIQKRAVDAGRDTDLSVLDTGTLFPPSTTFLTLRHDSFLHGYMQDFIGMVEPRWKPAALRKAVAAHGSGASPRPARVPPST